MGYFKKKNKKTSIKRSLIVLPLMILLVAVVGIGVVSSYLMRESLLDEMTQNGYYLSEKIIENIEDNDRALETISNMLDDKLMVVGKMVIGNEGDLSNDFLKNLVETHGIEQIHWYNADGEIIYSNIPEYVGWTATEGHAVHNFMIGNNQELLEEIRQDTESKEYFKYGYLKGTDGKFVQVGMIANRVHELMEAFSVQSLLEELVASEKMAYALIIDKNLRTIAHNNKEEIGIVFNSISSRTAAIDGIPYAHEWYYPHQDLVVLDVLYPLVVRGEHIGALSIGYSMDSLRSAINKNIWLILVSGIIAFGILGLILFKTTDGVIRIINRLKEQIGFMASGDFSKELPQIVTSRKDEFGEISQAISRMQHSMGLIIKNVLDTSQQLAASSEELTATSQQSAMAAEEVAKTIEEIAKGASNQAEDIAHGVVSISELGDIVTQNKEYIQSLNMSAERVNTLKNQGIEILKDLVAKSEINRHASAQVQGVIISTNESAGRIASASEMIKSIADQTNLLALNAAIEAARAGDAGRGFAVVSEEIRKLAEQSNAFTEEISVAINGLTAMTSNAVKTMDELEKIVVSQTESVNRTNNRFDGIAEALEEMKKMLHQVNHSSEVLIHKKENIISVMENLSAISEENAAGTQEASASIEEQTASMEEIARSSEALSSIAEELNRQVDRFKI